MTDDGHEPRIAPIEPRIAPLEPPYEPGIETMLEKWMPPNSGMEPLRLFRTLGVHADLASRMRPLGAGILGHGLLEPRLREVMIHRTCARCGAEYEWGVHAVAFGRPLGLSDAQLAATVHGTAEDAVWPDQERAVGRTVPGASKRLSRSRPTRSTDHLAPPPAPPPRPRMRSACGRVPGRLSDRPKAPRRRARRPGTRR